LFGLVKIVKTQVVYFVSCVHIHSKQWLYLRHNTTFFPIECVVVKTYIIYEDSSFMLFVPCIVDNYFTTVSQQNDQCSSWDILHYIKILSISTGYNPQGITIREQVSIMLYKTLFTYFYT